MKYEVLKWRIYWKGIWEVVDLPEEIGNAYWSKYLKPLEKTSIITRAVETVNDSLKQIKKWKNKALSANKVRNK